MSECLVPRRLIRGHTNFAIGRPIGTQEPESRPSPAAKWHVSQIENKESMTISVVADQSNTRPPRSTIRPFISRVYRHYYIGGIGRRVAILYGHGLVNVSQQSSVFAAYTTRCQLTEHGRRCRGPYPGLFSVTKANHKATSTAYSIVVELVKERGWLIVVD